MPSGARPSRGDVPRVAYNMKLLRRDPPRVYPESERTARKIAGMLKKQIILARAQTAASASCPKNPPLPSRNRPAALTRAIAREAKKKTAASCRTAKSSASATIYRPYCSGFVLVPNMPGATVWRQAADGSSLAAAGPGEDAGPILDGPCSAPRTPV